MRSLPFILALLTCGCVGPYHKTWSAPIVHLQPLGTLSYGQPGALRVWVKSFKNTRDKTYHPMVSQASGSMTVTVMVDEYAVDNYLYNDRQTEYASMDIPVTPRSTGTIHVLAMPNGLVENLSDFEKQFGITSFTTEVDLEVAY